MVRYSSQVVTYFPRCPKPSLLLVGEAPGPRGANRTGYPFWGDDSGLELYRLVESLELLDESFTPWTPGADLSGTRPPCGRYAITNACPQMPFRDKERFCAPEPSRLDVEAPRLLGEIRRLQPNVVLACGKAASYTLARAALLDGSVLPPPLSKTYSRFRLKAAIRDLVAQGGEMRWGLCGARVFVTTHPARQQWASSTSTGGLHAEVVELVRRAIRSDGE